MASKVSAFNRDDGKKWMPPNLLEAARTGNYSEALRAIEYLEKNHSSFRFDEDHPLRSLSLDDIYHEALEAAILTFHENVAFLILEKTNVTVKRPSIHAQGRDCLNLALFVSSQELCSDIADRWHKEREIELNPPNNLVPLGPR